MDGDNVKREFSATGVYATNPPPVPSSRGPSRKNGMRTAGGPPRSTPRRYRSDSGLRGSIVVLAANSGNGDGEKKTFDEQDTPARLSLDNHAAGGASCAQPANSCGALSGVGNGHDCHYHNDDDDEEDSLPSALPPPMPHPAVSPRHNAATANVNSLPLHGELETQALYYETHSNETNNGICLDSAVASKRTQATSVLPLSALQLFLTSFLGDVHALMGVMKGNLNLGCCHEFLMATEGIHNDMQSKIEELLLEDAAADKKLREAKAYQVASLDSSQPRQARGGGQQTSSASGKAQNKNDVIAEGEKKKSFDADNSGDLTAEMEAWRIEKGDLLAEKALLLQKRVELQHHLRRGTNIKNISGLLASRASSRTGRDGLNEDNSDGDGAPCVSDLETIQLRLELKEVQTRLTKLQISHRAAKENKQSRQTEMESEAAALRCKLAAAKKENEARRGALQEALKEAERLRGKCREGGNKSLLLPLERRINGALAALGTNNKKQSANEDFCGVTSNLSRCSSSVSALRRPSMSFS